MIELEEEYLENRLSMLVAGVGNAGCMVSNSLHGWQDELSLLAVDTDAGTLKQSRAEARIQLGSKITRGFGTAENPETARKALYDDRERLSGMLGRRDIVFIVAGLGGGAGSGIAPELAEMARTSGALSVAVATTPFVFEGKKRIANAAAALKELKEKADALIVIQNEDLFSQVNSESFLADAFEEASQMILEAVKNICEIMMNPGIFNVDLSRIRQMLGNSGIARFGVGEAEGAGRWEKGLEAALKCPLMKGVKLSAAENVLMHIRGGRDLTQDEIQKISARLFARGDELHGVTGVTVDRKLGKKIKVWLLFTGIKADASELMDSGYEKSSTAALPRYDMGGVKDELDIPAIYRRQKKD